MDDSAYFLTSIGALLLLGLLTSAIAKRSFLPRVTLLLIFGALLGRDGLNLIPQTISQHFDLVAQMTLLMVGFLLGGKLTHEFIGTSGREVMSISLIAAVITSVVVGMALWLLGVPPEIAILLGCIASATDAAAILDVITEAQDNSRFGKVLLSVVALDDAWGLVLFALGMSIAATMMGNQTDTSSWHHLWMAGKEIGGAILLGIAIGLPAAHLTGRHNPGQPMVSEALALVFICGGIAMWLEFSYLIASIVMGAVIANRAEHHDYPFHAIKDIESPFLVVFFILAGASLETHALMSIGLIGVVYVLTRSIGKILGAWIGGVTGKSSATTNRWMGTALLPQAGVAIGMALVASHEFPEHRQLLLSLVIGSTVLFEVIGPVFTRLALKRAGETHLPLP